MTKAQLLADGSTDELERGGGLTEYTAGLLARLRKALEGEPRYSKDARIVSLVDLCGAIQLIQAGAESLRDVERLDWYSSRHPAGTVVHQAINHTVVGTGIGARAALDDAMKRSNASGNGQAGVSACPVDRRVSRGGAE